MKQIADKTFFDSNIIVYCYTGTEPEKQTTAFKIIDECQNPVISTQVLQEFCNVAHKKFSAKEIDIEQAISEVESLFSVHVNSVNTIRKANDIKAKYGFSFYDSLIIAAAFECGCDTLYSEDLQDGQVIEKSLTIVNPFE
jgi:predicted nucleic acid-binding protein